MVFIHGSWLTAPKTFGISWMIRAMGKCFVIEFVLLTSVPKIMLEPQRQTECLVIHKKPRPTITGFMLMNNFWKSPKDGSWLLGEPTMNRRLECSVPLFLGRRGGLRFEPITNHQSFNYSYLCNKEASWKPKRRWFRKLEVWWTRVDLGTVLHAKTAWKLQALILYLALCVSAICSWVYILLV